MFSDFKLDKITNRLEFKIKDIDVSIVNGIRRVLISDISTLAFIGEGPELSIDIITNKTPLNNEIMNNRMCLLPLHFNDEETEGFNEDKDIYVFELNVENDTKELHNVYSSDMVIHNNDSQLKPAEIQRILPINSISRESILITRLRKNEKIHLKAYVKKRTGRFHTAFSPVSGCTYYFDYVQNKNADVLASQKDYKKKPDGTPEACIFSFEIINGLTHRYVVAKAIKVIIEKLNGIRNALETQTQDKIVNIKFASTNCCEFSFASEDDTIGNILQSYIHDTYVKSGKETFTKKRCTYVGYICPHPLQDIMNLRITLDGQIELQTFKTFLGVVCDNLNEILNNILNQWYKQTLSLDNK